MARHYKDLLEEDFARQIKFNNIEEYHRLGYKGDGIVILNAEGSGDHQGMTNKVIENYAPNAIVINGVPSGKSSGDKLIDYGVMIKNKKITFEDLIEKHSVKIITRSYSGTISKPVSNYFKELQNKYGTIFLCAAGNDASVGVTGTWAKYNTAIAVGAVKLKENGIIERTLYSAIGEELDFVSFMARGTGTSASSPALASMIALLLQRYGDFNQKECVEILKSISIDLGEKDRDNSYGYGLPVLPLTDRLEILEELRGDKDMTFKDVENDRWSKEAIDFCVEKGLFVGFEDGTFRPTESVTREQMAIILQRIYAK